MAKGKDMDSARRHALKAQIDENLRRVYASVLDEELPDRFKDLLARLKAGGDKAGDDPPEGGGAA